MVAAGTATFFDGITAARREVAVELGADHVAHPCRRRPASGRVALRRDREPVGAGRRAAAGQDRKSGPGAARSPRSATGHRDRRIVDADRPQRPGGTARPHQGHRLEHCGDRIAAPGRGLRRAGNRRTGLRRWCPIRSSASSAPRSTPRSAAPSIPATPVPHSNAEITTAKSWDARHSTSSWANSRRQPPSPYRSIRPWCAGTKPMLSRCRAAASMSSRD